MKNLLVLTGIICTLFCSSCKKELFGCLEPRGDVFLETISLDQISSIESGINAEIIIMEGKTQKIEIEAEQNVIDRIVADSKVDSDTWKLEIDGCSNLNAIKIIATLTELEDLELNGSGSMRTEGIFSNVQNLKLKINGSGNMNIALAQAEELDMDISGEGDIKVSGSCLTEKIQIDGDGNIKAFDLTSNFGDVDIDGSGTVEIFSKGILNVDIDGSGTVCYRGTPEIFLDISGSGSVNDCN